MCNPCWTIEHDRRTRANLTLAPFFQDDFFAPRAVNALPLPCEWVGGTSLIRAALKSPPFSISTRVKAVNQAPLRPTRDDREGKASQLPEQYSTLNIGSHVKN